MTDFAYQGVALGPVQVKSVRTEPVTRDDGETLGERTTLEPEQDDEGRGD